MVRSSTGITSADNPVQTPCVCILAIVSCERWVIGLPLRINEISFLGINASEMVFILLCERSSAKSFSACRINSGGKCVNSLWGRSRMVRFSKLAKMFLGNSLSRHREITSSSSSL
eukprot:Pompholyxophrys_sp_v1_NODE_27_length_3750_cov_2.904465.p5 type:complete len:116 gc:universal NODE_27_length_3750_cov_2.904465:3602-3255(-)